MNISSELYLKKKKKTCRKREQNMKDKKGYRSTDIHFKEWERKDNQNGAGAVATLVDQSVNFEQ